MDDLIIKITAYDLVMEEVSQDSVDDDMPSYIVREHAFVANDYL